MKRYLPLLLAVIGVIFIATIMVGRTKPETDGITVYTYDSFISEWGPGPEIAKQFTEQSGITVNYVAPGDAGQTLQRLINEKEASVADVAIGIDNNLFPKAEEEGIFRSYTSPELKKVDSSLRFEDDLLTPYDYSDFAFIWDSQALENPPQSFADLTDPRFKEKIIIMDPRTSTPGLGLLLWSEKIYGDKLFDFWKAFAPNILTVSSSWDTGYGLFTSGEAPLVISYTTSPPYHLEYEGTERYKALIFPEGHYMQIEGAGVVAGTKHRKAAEAFIDFLISEDAQAVIPLTNWMYPVREGTPLPDSFRLAPKPDKQLQINPAPDGKTVDTLIELWTKALLQ
ncbi:thiamine ABC transporter substrate-binding protein [Sediminispirochaeta bajacaliforniensis]|uniref:thiamine ABC transporter substrate-binding protein n=1 Tax=Sediminispirochaeta bajacaliforniensis TaxID=148 RepID=UPI00036BF5D1|nr:thiamine ABC transporter substrate-binding protein [Sediminispirochaeta bajacaliforniensis]